MAKEKSESSSPDVTLSQALLSEEERPYKTPENWVWTKLNYIADLKSGTSLQADIELPEGKMLYIKVADMNLSENQFEIIASTRYVNVYNESQLIPKDSILFPKRGGAIFTNKKRIIRKPLLADLNIMAITPRVSLLYVYYWFLTVDLAEINNGSNVPQINNKDIAPLLVPVPPLAEQQRIVDRIEGLFQRLDSAKELAQNALDTFETRKAAILHKAFTGEFTAQWRVKNGVDFKKEWVKKELGACGDWVGGGTPSKNCRDYWSNGNILWVSPKDMKSMYIDDTEDKITETAIEYSSTRLIQEEAILFVVRSGILRRILPIAITAKPVTVNQDIKALVPKGITTKYLYWFCVCHESDIRTKCAKSGTTVESISTDLLYKYSAIIPSIKEQEEIVRILDNLLEKEDKAKELCNVIEKIDIMKKAILARAFRGELDE